MCSGLLLIVCCALRCVWDSQAWLTLAELATIHSHVPLCGGCLAHSVVMRVQQCAAPEAVSVSQCCCVHCWLIVWHSSVGFQEVMHWRRVDVLLLVWAALLQTYIHMQEQAVVNMSAHLRFAFSSC